MLLVRSPYLLRLLGHPVFLFLFYSSNLDSSTVNLNEYSRELCVTPLDSDNIWSVLHMIKLHLYNTKNPLGVCCFPFWLSACSIAWRCHIIHVCPLRALWPRWESIYPEQEDTFFPKPVVVLFLDHVINSAKLFTSVERRTFFLEMPRFNTRNTVYINLSPEFKCGMFFYLPLYLIQ